MMDTAVKQPTDSHGQTIITPTERQTLIQRLAARWPLELSKQIENEAFKGSQGNKHDYFKLIQSSFQRVQTLLQNRANQQQQQNNNVQFRNSPQPTSIPNVTHVQHPVNPSSRFPVVQQTPVMMMNNPQASIPNQITRLREPSNMNQTPNNTLTYSQSPASTTTTTIDLTQGYPIQQVSTANQNNYAILQPRYPVQPMMNIPRQRTSISNNTFQQQQQQPIVNAANDVLHQLVVGNSSSTSITATSHTNNSSNSDQLLQRILLLQNDGGTNKSLLQNQQTTLPVMPQLPRSSSEMNSNRNNSTNSLRTSLSSHQLSSSPSVVIIPTPTQTSTVQIQPLSNITIQQSPLNNSNGPLSVNSQPVSVNSSTPILANYASPTKRAVQPSGSGNISSPDNETLNLIQYLKDNVNRLQLLTQKFTNEGNIEKVRQVQSIQQQILQFITNPTYETLANAKHFRDMLDRIPNRSQPTNPISSQINSFNQCLKATNEFLARDYKERINITKRYLEPLSDVMNGVPHKIMRLDGDDNFPTKIRSSHQSSLLSDLNDEINQLPNEIYSIECIPVSRTRKTADNDQDYVIRNGFILRCKLLEKCNPVIPRLRLHITTAYPEQPPEVLSLTKTMPPRLEFTDGHPFFDQISSTFVSHLFKLRPQHTVTDILNIWRLSVQTAL